VTLVERRAEPREPARDVLARARLAAALAPRDRGFRRGAR